MAAKKKSASFEPPESGFTPASTNEPKEEGVRPGSMADKMQKSATAAKAREEEKPSNEDVPAEEKPTTSPPVTEKAPAKPVVFPKMATKAVIEQKAKAKSVQKNAGGTNQGAGAVFDALVTRIENLEHTVARLESDLKKVRARKVISQHDAG